MSLSLQIRLQLLFQGSAANKLGRCLVAPHASRCNQLLTQQCILTRLLPCAQVILMDHVDWQDLAQARELAAVLAKQVAPGGRVIWRSAALCPPYARVIREAGFDVKCLQRADEVRPHLACCATTEIFTWTCLYSQEGGYMGVCMALVHLRVITIASTFCT